MRRFAYLGQGRLYVKSGEEPPRAVDSPFALSVRQRAQEIEQRHNWKSEGRGARFMSGGLLWGAPTRDAAGMRIAFTSLGRGRASGEIIYAIDSDGLVGICTLGADGVERRLLHGSERRIQHLALADGGERIACAVAHKDGTANLALMRGDASELTEITEGDSVDLAPSWIPGRPRLVYQSAGLGRDREGRPAGVGRFEIHALDIERGEIATLASDGSRDLLGPRVDAGGNLYYIRRPVTRREGASFLASTLDFLLFPARLLFALFQYLNFFTARYTGRPLTTAGGPRRQGADARQMMVWGNLIAAEQAAQPMDGEEPPSVVPSSWQLVRQARDGSVSVIAGGVIAFDLFGDGSLLYSTGRAIYHAEPGQAAQRLHADSFVEQVVALD
jgi:hypothetical protein